jgi:transposase-like protein
MSEGQRWEAMAALEKTSVVGGAAGVSAKKGGKRSRQKDALGTISGERVAAQGCPHCVGREVVGWRRSHGLLRFRCKSYGRTFNALTKTPMAHLRKKEKWLDHARAMIEGKSLAKTAALCGVHPTTACGRHADPRAGAGAGGRQAQVSVPSGDKVAASDTAANVPGLLNAAQITALPAIGVSLVRVSSASDLALTVAQVAALDVKSRPLDSKRTARRPVGHGRYLRHAHDLTRTLAFTLALSSAPPGLAASAENYAMASPIGVG